MTPEEAELHGAAYPAVINDYDIMQAVESRLRKEPDRVAHILYSLSFRGGVDPAASGSFKTAADFLEWLYSSGAYPDIRAPIPPLGTRPETDWWPPRNPKHPDTVIKRDGARKQFGFDQFRNSIKLALHGRHETDKIARLIAQFALFHLEGQTIVRTAQLADQVILALRMVDDIAYLRYVGIAKGFVSVRDFASEARGLRNYPSPKLQFNPKQLRSTVPIANFHSRTENS